MQDLVTSGIHGQSTGMVRLIELCGLSRMTGPTTKWDGACPGLGVRINKSGAAVWVGKFRQDGKQILLTFGSVDEISYEQAKELLRSARAGFVQSGLTFKRFAQIYLDDYSTKKKATWDEERRRINRYLLPAFGDMQLSAIKSVHTRELHGKISEKTPRQADQVLSLLRVMFSRAIDWELLPEDHPTPFRSISWNKKVVRDRFITEKEMPRVMSVVAKLPRIEQRAILIMYVLTACRKMELVDLRWDEIDFENKRIKLVAGRNKARVVVYKELSDFAIRILKSLPSDQVYVFPGRYRNTRMKEVSSLWRKVRKEAGIEDVWLHDLRRTAGSWLAQSGESLHLISKVLGQTTEHVTKTYAYFENQHIREAIQRHSDKVEKFLPSSSKTTPDEPATGNS